MTSHLRLIAGQLNAPYGQLVRSEDIAQALRDHSLASLDVDDWVKELIAHMFVELSPQVIGYATLEAGARLENAQILYEDARNHWGVPRVATWEHALEGVLS